ncbi:MAG: GspMb/PilO family protein [Syntrophales bacterium]
MADLNRQKEIKKIGIYVIVILALIRFVVYPLHASVEERKLMVSEQYESYRLKYQLLEKYRQLQSHSITVDKAVLFPYLYEREIRPSYIQTDVIEKIVKLAEKEDLTVLSFEMLEPVAEKNLSEIPVLIRLKGMPGAFIELLKTMETGEKALSIKSMEISRSGQELIFSLTISAFRTEK